jgi:hypothetical protein
MLFQTQSRDTERRKDFVNIAKKSVGHQAQREQ